MGRLILSLITSGFTLTGMWAVGSHKAWGWALGLVTQAFWVAFILVFAAWGLLPLTACLVVIYTRNLLKWRREDAEPDIIYDVQRHAEENLVHDLRMLAIAGDPEAAATLRSLGRWGIEPSP